MVSMEEKLVCLLQLLLAHVAVLYLLLCVRVQSRNLSSESRNAVSHAALCLQSSSRQRMRDGNRE